MPVTDEDVAEARRAARNKRNQERMEKEIYGEPLPLPKPEKPAETTILPGKPEKKKDLGEGAVKYAKGGTASSRADGCAVRGKTKGRIV
jgi:hypothetical protein